MVKFALIAAASVAAMSLGGCANTRFADNIKELVDAGCKGDVTASAQAGTATGLSPGSATGQVQFHGSCDHANVVPAAAPVDTTAPGLTPAPSPAANPTPHPSGS